MSNVDGRTPTHYLLRCSAFASSTAVCAMGLVSLLACGSGPRTSVENLDVVEMSTATRALGLEQGWGPCYRESMCWRSIAVADDRSLTLSDSMGTETHSVTETEFSQLWAVIEGDEFRVAAEDVASLRCGDPVLKGSANWVIDQHDGQQRLVTDIGSCARNQAHPYRDVLQQLVNLRIRYHPCTAFSYPPGFVVGVDEPPVRPLCVPCAGLC